MTALLLVSLTPWQLTHRACAPTFSFSAFSHYLKELVWKILGIAIDAWFITDIYLNFHTGYVHNGYIIMDLDKIYEHYADPWHGWLIVDVLGSIPIDYIFEIIEQIGVTL